MMRTLKEDECPSCHGCICCCDCTDAEKELADIYEEDDE